MENILSLFKQFLQYGQQSDVVIPEESAFLIVSLKQL